MPRAQTRRSAQRRAEILDGAVDLASAEGLSGVSIGSLAASVGMSKSGLFAHFGSKEDLQLATIDRAREAFEEAVLAPAASEEPGLPRLERLVACWLSYLESIPYRGGCFFDAASSEFGSQPGPVRDRLAQLCSQWLSALEEQARLAVRLRELSADTDPRCLAFRLHAYAGEANWARELLDDAGAFERAREAAAVTLAAARTAPHPDHDPDRNGPRTPGSLAHAETPRNTDRNTEKPQNPQGDPA